ncbi:hypothetical protein ACMFMG_000494 [Clarireedia jacksonii]
MSTLQILSPRREYSLDAEYISVNYATSDNSMLQLHVLPSRLDPGSPVRMRSRQSILLDNMPRPSPSYTLALVIPTRNRWSLFWMHFHRVVPVRCTPSCNECIVCETCHTCGPIDRIYPRYLLEVPFIAGIPPPSTRPTVERCEIGVEGGSPVMMYALRSTETHNYPVNLGLTAFTEGRQEEAWRGPLLITGCSGITCMKESRVRDITMDDVNAARESLATSRRREALPRRAIVQRRDEVLSDIMDNILKRGTT